MDILRNQVTAIIGPSGCGKSTFLRCLNRLHELVPNTRVAGTILFEGMISMVSTNPLPSAGASGWSFRNRILSRPCRFRKTSWLVCVSMVCATAVSLRNGQKRRSAWLLSGMR